MKLATLKGFEYPAWFKQMPGFQTWKQPPPPAYPKHPWIVHVQFVVGIRPVQVDMNQQPSDGPTTLRRVTLHKRRYDVNLFLGDELGELLEGGMSLAAAAKKFFAYDFWPAAPMAIITTDSVEELNDFVASLDENRPYTYK